MATTESADAIGGLDQLKGWLEKRRDAFGQAARDYGLPSPKGIVAALQQPDPPFKNKSSVRNAWRACTALAAVEEDNFSASIPTWSRRNIAGNT
jgi:hypothetical protein